MLKAKIALLVGYLIGAMGVVFLFAFSELADGFPLAVKLTIVSAAIVWVAIQSRPVLSGTHPALVEYEKKKQLKKLQGRS